MKYVTGHVICIIGITLLVLLGIVIQLRHFCWHLKWLTDKESNNLHKKPMTLVEELKELYVGWLNYLTQ